MKGYGLWAPYDSQCTYGSMLRVRTFSSERGGSKQVSIVYDLPSGGFCKALGDSMLELPNSGGNLYAASATVNFAFVFSMAKHPAVCCALSHDAKLPLEGHPSTKP